jgi:hypothetical protein
MTLPIAYRRSTAAERRANRAAFQKLKAAVAASPETAKRKAKARGDDVRCKALQKMRAAIAGKTNAPFTALQLSKLKPDELAQLRTFSAGRFAALDADQRKRLSTNLYLLIATVPDDVYRAVAHMPTAAPAA